MVRIIACARFRVFHRRCQPTVTEAADPFQGLGRESADPEGEVAALGRLRFHGHGGGTVELAVEIDALIAPAGAQEGDGLVHAPPAIAEILLKRIVLGLLPADAHAEAHAPAREGIQGAGLLGNQYGLALGKYQHLGAEADAPR